MKILQVINNLNTGGAEKLILETIPLLKKKGIEIDLLVFDGSDYPYMTQLRALNCCNIISLGPGSLFNLLHIFKIIPYLKKYDIIHVHLFPAQYWVIAAKILSFSKTKLIFTEHSTSNRRMQNFWLKSFDKKSYKYYNKIICISNEVKQVLLDYCISKQKDILIIENGVNLDAINEANSILKKEIDRRIVESDKLLIQVAGFRIEKDQKTVIKSLQFFEENIKLILVGDGIFRNECEDLVKELRLNDRVFFLGVRTDVPSLLKTADISIVSSHWEGFGLVAVEGMAVGKPLIASNVEGLSNVVKGAGILFEKGNEEDLSAKIIKLFSDKEYYKEKSEAGIEVAKKYDINLMVDRQLNVYNELLKE